MTTYHGSCFCGAVAFEADGDLSQGTMRCNCSFCRKMRYWEMRLPDPDGFRLIKGAEFLAETPRSSDDGSNYDLISRVKEMVAIPGEPELQQMTAFYQELTQLRKSSPLFTLGDGSAVMKRVSVWRSKLLKISAITS